MDKGNRLAAITFNRRRRGNAVTLKVDIAAIARIHSSQDFDQRGFTRAVFS
ncbi:hypothetical protein D3C79_624020 [compost metagenome]